MNPQNRPLRGVLAFLAQVEMCPEVADECVSACLDAGGSEEECMEECAA